LWACGRAAERREAWQQLLAEADAVYTQASDLLFDARATVDQMEQLMPTQEGANACLLEVFAILDGDRRAVAARVTDALNGMRLPDSAVARRFVALMFAELALPRLNRIGLFEDPSAPDEGPLLGAPAAPTTPDLACLIGAASKIGGNAELFAWLRDRVAGWLECGVVTHLDGAQEGARFMPVGGSPSYFVMRRAEIAAWMQTTIVKAGLRVNRVAP
jgi:hypothetical protein